MPRITDDHFAKIPGAGPKRVQERIVAPEPSVRPWRVVFGLLVVALVGYGIWAYWAGRFDQAVEPFREPAESFTVAPSPFTVPAPAFTPEPVAAVMAPNPVVEQVDQVAAPVVDQRAIARKRRALTETIESLGRGVSNIERQAAECRADIVPLVYQVNEAEKKQWPKPNGGLTYEGYLGKLMADAKKAKDGSREFDLHGQWQTFRDNRNKTLLELERVRGLLASCEKRLAAAKADRAAAQAELATLP